MRNVLRMIVKEPGIILVQILFSILFKKKEKKKLRSKMDIPRHFMNKAYYGGNMV